LTGASENTSHALGVSLALLSALAWAIGATIYQRLSTRVTPFGLNLSTTTLGTLLVGALWLVTGGGTVDGHGLALLVASGLLGIALGDTLFFGALQQLGAHAAVVLALLSPALTVVLAVALLGERPPALAWAGVALILAGVAVVLRGKAAAQGRQTTARGLLLGLGAVAAMAFGTLVTKRGLDTVPALDATVVRMAAATLGLVGMATLQSGGFGEALACVRGPVRGAVLGAVAVVTFGGFLGLHAALRQVDLSVAAAAHATEPLWVLPLAWRYLGEPVTRAAVVGSALALVGVAVLYAE
jgi:drug/metabolite transporter (DMT)-like permease